MPYKRSAYTELLALGTRQVLISSSRSAAQLFMTEASLAQ